MPSLASKQRYLTSLIVSVLVCSLLLMQSTSSEKMSPAVELYPRMDPALQKAFYTCYKNNGKISTKKLIASFIDKQAIGVARVVVAQANYDVPDAPATTNDPPADDDVQWLRDLRRGPGISPCVMRTCERLNRSMQDQIDTLAFFEALAATALELSRQVQAHGVNVPELVAQAREQRRATETDL